MNGDACVIEANPDVSGVGIRVSIYALCLTSRLLPFFVNLTVARDRNRAAAAAEFERASTSALGLQGLALLCTAVVQTAQRRLTLFHAIAVQHLLALLGINIAARGRYGARGWLRRSILDAAVAALAALAFVAFDVYVWATAPVFGPQHECNDSTVYVVFGVSVSATSDVFRYIILATFAVVPASFLIVGLLGLPCWIAVCCSLRGRNRGGSGCRGNGLRLNASCCGWPAGAVTDAESGSEDPMAPDEDTPDPRITEGLQAVAYAVVSIYAIVSLEQMIERNHLSEEEQEWSFGQVIAIFLLGGTFYELAQVIISGIGNRASRRSDPIALRAISGAAT